MLKSLLNEAAGLKVCNFIKKRLSHSCFPLNIAKFLRVAFFKEHLWWLLLICLTGPKHLFFLSLREICLKNNRAVRKVIIIDKIDSLVSDFWDFIYDNVVCVVYVKGALSGLRLFLVTEIHLTTMKSAFYFT